MELHNETRYSLQIQFARHNFDNYQARIRSVARVEDGR